MMLPWPTDRVCAWFSCGDASAVAAKLTVEKHGPKAQVLYCDTLAYEHPDNRRFLADVERWLGQPIIILKSDDYADIYDVFDRTGYLVGPKGARCTTELKKNVRKAYQRIDDLHVFGYTADERDRVLTFFGENPDVCAEFPLIEHGITKAECHRRVAAAGIQIPAMYRLGYKNNNCIGCVKGQMGYWNKIRVDFPLVFARMAKQERKMDVAINKRYVGTERIRVFLDELDPKAGRYEAEDGIECGVGCEHPAVAA